MYTQNHELKFELNKDAEFLDLMEDLKMMFGWSARKLASKLGISPHTSINNKDRSINELTPRTRYKFECLFKVGMRVEAYDLVERARLAVIDRVVLVDQDDPKSAISVSMAINNEMDVDEVVKLAVIALQEHRSDIAKNLRCIKEK